MENNDGKQKYKAIIKRYSSDEITGENSSCVVDEKYTYAKNIESAKRNIAFQCRKNGIRLGYVEGDGMYYSTWCDIDKIDLEDNFGVVFDDNYNQEELKEILDGKYKKIKQVKKLDFFHPNGLTQTILRDDDYFLNNRANHFIIIDGEDEKYAQYDENDNNSIGAFIIICNHKGDTRIEFYVGCQLGDD